MPSGLDLDSLLIYDPNRARSTVNVWVARPTPAEEESHGKIFLITAIDSASHANHEIIDIIQDELRHNYYQPTVVNVERQFEEALHKTNQRLHALIADGVNDWVERAHILAGVIRGQHMVLAPVRVVHAFVLRQSRLHDVLGQPDETPPNPLRIFSQVITGQIEPKDRLLFCLPSLLDYFSLEKLRRTMLDHPPLEAVRILEQALVGVDPSMSFGALIMMAAETTVTPVVSAPITKLPPPTQTNAPQQSMTTLVNRERATEKILTPSVWPVINELIHSVSRSLQKFVRTKLLRLPPRRHLTTGAVPPVDIPDSPRPEKSSNFRFGIIVGKVRIFFSAMTAIFRRRSAPTPEQYPVTRFTPVKRSWFEHVTNWWLRINARQRWVVGIVVVAVILLVTAIFNIGSGGETKTASTTSTVAEVQAALDSGQSALLYGGEQTAQASLTTAVDAYNRLPNKGEAKDKKPQLAQQIEELRQRLNHRVTITSPTPWVNLASAATGFSPAQTYLLAKSLLAYDPASHAAVVVDRPSAAVSTAPLTLDIGRPITGAVVSTKSVVFVTDRRGLVELDTTTKTWKTFDSSFGSLHPGVQGLAAFQSRIYLLDRSENYILRFTRGGTSYGTGINWLKETADFSQSRGLAVDGSIYVLQAGGQVQEYFSGRKSSFALDAVDPALTNATRIWTSDAATHIYLLDPDQKRVVVFDKDGHLTKQYFSESWTALKDIAVDEASRTIYLLNGTDIYRVTIVS